MTPQDDFTGGTGRENEDHTVVVFSPAWERHVRHQIALMPIMGFATALFGCGAAVLVNQGRPDLAMVPAIVALLSGLITWSAWATVRDAFFRERHNTLTSIQLLNKQWLSQGGKPSGPTAGERGHELSPAVNIHHGGFVR